MKWIVTNCEAECAFGNRSACHRAGNDFSLLTVIFQRVEFTVTRSSTELLCTRRVPQSGVLMPYTSSCQTGQDLGTTWEQNPCALRGSTYLRLDHPHDLKSRESRETLQAAHFNSNFWRHKRQAILHCWMGVRCLAEVGIYRRRTSADTSDGRRHQ